MVRGLGSGGPAKRDRHRGLPPHKWRTEVRRYKVKGNVKGAQLKLADTKSRPETVRIFFRKLWDLLQVQPQMLLMQLVFRAAFYVPLWQI